MNILLFAVLPLMLWKDLHAHCPAPPPCPFPFLLSWGSVQKKAMSPFLELTKDLRMGVVVFIFELCMC